MNHPLAGRRPGRLDLGRLIKANLRLYLSFVFSLIILCQFSAPSIVKAAPAQPIEPASQNAYLLDKAITWADGSTEHVQIGRDGYFILDGEQKQLVGIDLSLYDMPFGEGGQFWLPENLAVYDKILTYAQAAGIRVVHLQMQYIYWWLPSISKETNFPSSCPEEATAYKTLLDLLYQHKMLVIPGIYGKWQPGFENLVNPDFQWSLWWPDSKNCTPTFLPGEMGRDGNPCVGIRMSENKPDAWSRWLKDIPVEAGKSYLISGWIKTESIVGNGGAMIVPWWKGPGDTWIGSSQVMKYVTGTNGWTYYQGTVVAPAGSTRCTICCFLDSCTGTAWFEDIGFGEAQYPVADTMGAWAERWISVVNKYSNVVSVVAENELDTPLQGKVVDPDSPDAKPQTYTIEAAANYMDFLIGVLRTKSNIPIVHKLGAPLGGLDYQIPLKKVCLDRTDNPVFDCYAPSVEQMNKNLDVLTSWLGQNGYRSTGWWALEIGNDSSMYNSNFTPDYIDAAFKHGASIVTLFEVYCGKYDQWSFFNADGTPKKQFVAVAGYIGDQRTAMSNTTASNVILASGEK